MNNEDKFSSAKKWTSNRELSSPTECERAFIAGAEWKDAQFAALLRTELATWQGNSAEAKYKREMLKELLDLFK